MAQYKNLFEVDLSGKNAPVMLRSMISEGNAAANIIGAAVFDNCEPVQLNGSCTGRVLRADGNTIALVGTIDGNTAYVTLDSQCYAIPGTIVVIVNWVSGENVTTLVKACGTVERTQSGGIIETETIPNLDELLAQIERMEEVTEAAEAVVESVEPRVEALESVVRIPPAYRQVEYLDNGGSAYIDIAEPLTGDSRVFCVFALNSVPTTSTKPVFGWYRGSYDSYAIAVQNGNWMYRYGNQATLQLLKNGADRNIHVLDFNKGTISLDGTVCAENDELEFTAGTLFRVFGSQSGVAAQKIIGDVRIYRFDWYKGNALVHSYIPVERVADGVLGLWDLVDEAFITATAGTFSKGYNINLLNNALAIDELKAAVANGVTAAQMDAIDAQVTYTAVMTDTLL